MTLNMKMILLSLALLTVGFEVAYGGKLPKNLDKTKGQGGLERINENWLGFNNSTKWVMRKVRKMIKAFDILEEQFVNVNESMVADMADMADMNNTLVSQLVSASADIASNTAGVASNSANIMSNDGDIMTLANAVVNVNETMVADMADMADMTNTLVSQLVIASADIASNTADIASASADIVSNDADIASLVQDIASNDLEIVSLKTNGPGSVWFDAVRMSTFSAFSSWTIITYSYQMQGSTGLSTTTGKFTAPLAGTYQFFILVMKYTGVRGDVRILYDGTVHCTISDTDTSSYTPVTCTAIFEMQAGEKAWAESYNKLWGGGSGSPDFHFTGVLIAPK